MRKYKPAFLISMIFCIFAGVLITGCSRKNSTAQSNVLNVYNWGEYIDEDVITAFEDTYHIKVNYKTYDTNEDLYSIISAGGASWDVICPSDYMIQKMIENNLLLPLDYDHIPNVSNIGSVYMEKSTQFDPGNIYSVPYCWGTVGIIYNTSLVPDPIDSWNALWDDNYADSIIMMNNPRDNFMPPLALLGASINSRNPLDLEKATECLKEQKSLVLKYTTDEVRDMMIGEKASVAMIYSGEAIAAQDENENLTYVVPKEGSNVWIDSWCIPTTCLNKENAEKWIDFMCDGEIALRNFDYIYYSTPNTAAINLIDDPELLNNETMFPDDSILSRCETYEYLGEDIEELYYMHWKKVLSY